MGIAKLINEVKQFGDYEFYPTEKAQIDVIKNRIEEMNFNFSYSVLDIGAGDGRVLNQIAHRGGDKYAIEKSLPLLHSLSPDVFVVGTEFMEQTLLDIDVNITFCNPPFKQFSEFATKIINESMSPDIFLILPKRWKEDESIKQALKRRKAETFVLGEYDYLKADRPARCKVNVIHIQLSQYHRRYYDQCADIDPFQCWFYDNFDIDAVGKAARKSEELNQSPEKENLDLLAGGDLINSLVEHYDASMQRLIDTFKGLEKVDGKILDELNVSLNSICGALKARIKSLKNSYWQQFFNRFEPITNKLCTETRREMQSLLMQNVNVDFTRENAYAIAEWAVKNVNKYIDSQLISTFEKLVSESSIVLYKSNKRTFGNSDWRYNSRPEGLDRFALDHRIVKQNYKNFSSYSSDLTNGLANSTADFINDLITIAYNLGYDITGMERAESVEAWEPGKMRTFHYYDHTTEKKVVLFTARAYLKGTLHIKMNQGFIARLNVEFGKLKGWVSSPKEAAEEIKGVDLDLAKKAFSSSMKIKVGTSFLKLT